MVGGYDAALHLETFLCHVKEGAAVLMFFSSFVFVNSRFHAVESITRVCFLTMFVRTFTICIPATKLAFHKPYGSHSIASS